MLNWGGVLPYISPQTMFYYHKIRLFYEFNIHKNMT